MAKRQSSKMPGTKPNPREAAGGAYKDHNLAGMDPMKCQEGCKPTESKPVNMHKQMAGAL